ncbi:hypothetical protein C8Q79DRAFT_230034 [Trametes meyenii]|nr:hypothetical protein C8Q79DRAFT_230034 [Trametes meyenii]
MSLEEREIIDTFSWARTTITLFFSATALFCFDYALTLPQEAQRIWKLKLTPSALISYCVRYPALFSTPFVILDQTRWRGISNALQRPRAHRDGTQHHFAHCCSRCKTHSSAHPLLEE